ncbi:hypothetical protein ABZX95_39080 [Streptomyces sp. NPDC004232]|uniref:hypothetical protein n=1 Tax=Streptomyces sp. NPDC004232 TaxID=3154454 RepID=UPI001D5F038B|nr:hypothetical protein [Streptomyces sp. tea 10]
MRTRKQLTPLGAVGAGLAAGVIGTLCMDTVRFLRQRRTDGEHNALRWEFAQVRTWQEAPDPGQVGKRLAEAFTLRKLPDSAAFPISAFMHWAYGMGNAVCYSVVSASLRKPHVLYGLPYGALVWLSGYVLLPIAGLYKPIWTYDTKTLGDDLTAHLAYGVGTSSAFWLLSRVSVFSRQL